MTKSLFLLSWIGVLLMACDKEEKADQMQARTLIQNEQPPVGSEDFYINSVQREGNVLKVNVKHGGACSPTPQFDLYEVGGEDPCSMPVTVQVVFKNPAEECVQEKESELYFDISALKKNTTNCQDKLQVLGYEEWVDL